jgi:hypothetical protein
VGPAVAVLWSATALVDQVQRPADFARTEVPGSVSAAVTRTGPHLVYVEVPGGAVPGLIDDLRVVGPTGEQVELRAHDVGLQYDAPGGLLATSVAVFEAERTGTYTVTAHDAPAAPGTRVALGDDLAPDVLRAVALPALAGLLSLVAALSLAVTARTARRQVARRTAHLPATSPSHGETR